jgi:hypothetical protein
MLPILQAALPRLALQDTGPLLRCLREAQD